MYLTILSRFPTEEELKIVEAYFQSGKVEPARGGGGPGLGLDQQRGVSLPALIEQPEGQHEHQHDSALIMNTQAFKPIGRGIADSARRWPCGAPISRREALRRGSARRGRAAAGRRPEAARAGRGARRQGQSQVGHPDLDVGRPVATSTPSTPSRRPATTTAARSNKPIATNVDGHPDRRAAAAAGQAGRQVLDHPQHDPRQQRPRNGLLHGPDRPDARRAGWSIPSVGAVVSLFKGYDAGYKGLIPPYIVLTEPQGRFSEAGFLGSRYKPFATGGDPGAGPLRRRRRRRPGHLRPAAAATGASCCTS